jgi:hypothetical protein
VDQRERNRRLMRELNDRVRQVFADSDRSGAEFVCECGWPECVATVRLPFEEYDRLEGDRSRLVVHGTARRERVSQIVSSSAW